jgi:hypothetical protein
VAEFRVDPAVQARIEILAERANFISILKLKASRRLNSDPA